MMKQTVKSLLFLTILICLACSQQEVRNKTKNPAPSNKTEKALPPSIRKCLNVSCEAGQFCFHGRCKKIDYECLNKQCGAGQRCNKGQCVKQLHEPQKLVCTPLGFQQVKEKCTDQIRAKCQGSVNKTKVCAYFPDGTKEDFDSECSACLKQKNAKFFFRTSCKWGASVCKVDQECLNGACVSIFNEAIFKNYRSCNQNKDCKVNERCGGHKCIDRRDLFNYLQSQSENKLIGFNI